MNLSPHASLAPSAANGAVAAPLAYNEAARLQALQDYDVLDNRREQAFDDIAMLASAVCHAPMAFVTLIDADRQILKAREGLNPDAEETSRDVSFCAHAIRRPDEVMEVPDATLDPRFATNPQVTGPPGIRFYAGAPMVTAHGVALGTICVVDTQPRTLSDGERRALKSLARQAVAQLELRRAVANLETEGLTDGLTQVGNRRAFDRRLREHWGRHAHDHAPLALLMVDLDHFKRINDDFGHPTGDAVLQQTAQLLQRGVRQSDVVARFGGEEFAIILPHADLPAALGVADKLLGLLRAAPWEHQSVTASIGAAAATPDPEDSAATLLARADRALYSAKQTGRDRVVGFEGWH